MEAEVALLVLVFTPLFILWVVALFHIVLRRPDLSIAGKGLWSATVTLLGYAGLLLYTMLRPPRPVNRTGLEEGKARQAALHRLGQLIEGHDAGSISDEEFAHGKAAVFGLESSGG